MEKPSGSRPYDYAWPERGCVYFVWAPAANLVKIGWTGDHPDDRLKSLRAGSPVELEPLSVLPGDVKDERELHRRFRDCWHHGEWFSCVSGLAEFIRDETRPWPDPMPSPEAILATKGCYPGESFNAPEAAALLECSVATLRQLAARGHLGNAWVKPFCAKYEDLIAWMPKRRPGNGARIRGAG